MVIVQDISKTQPQIIKKGPYSWHVIAPVLGEKFQGGFVLKFKTVSEHKTKAQARKALQAI